MHCRYSTYIKTVLRDCEENFPGCQNSTSVSVDVKFTKASILKSLDTVAENRTHISDSSH